MLRDVPENLIMCNIEHWLAVIYKLLAKYEPESEHPCDTHSLKDSLIKWMQHLNILADATVEVSVVEAGTKANTCISAMIQLLICLFVFFNSLKIPIVAKVRGQGKNPDGYLRD